MLANRSVAQQAYNATEEADALAEAYLTKAVKLDPTNVDAVLCLGEALWKRRALADAQICFQQAVMRSPTNRGLATAVMGGGWFRGERVVSACNGWCRHPTFWAWWCG